MYEVEHDMPIPLSSNHGRQKYPFNKMSFGDSFYVPGARQSRILASAYAYCKRYKITDRYFTTRIVHDANGERIGIRCWLLAREPEPPVAQLAPPGPPRRRAAYGRR